MSSLAVIPAAAIGCGDDDGGAGGGAGGGSGSGGGAGGGAGATCEDIVADQDLPAACDTCLCTDCDSQVIACHANANCQDDVDCAQTAIANETCDANAAVGVLLACINTACGGDDDVVESEAILLLNCTKDNCLAQCAGGGGDGGL